MLAVGLESGEILIYTSPRHTPSQWTNMLAIDNQYVLMSSTCSNHHGPSC